MTGRPRKTIVPDTVPPNTGRKIPSGSLAAARNTLELQELFGRRLRKYRRRLGLSQEAVAFRAQTHPAGMSSLELGKTAPYVDTLIRLAGALEITPGALAAGAVWKPPEVFMMPGGFQVADDPALFAEAAALREEAARRRVALEQRAKGRRAKK